MLSMKQPASQMFANRVEPESHEALSSQLTRNKGIDQQVQCHQQEAQRQIQNMEHSMGQITQFFQ